MGDEIRQLSDNIAAESDSGAEPDAKHRYYAVLCMDGDDMGQWVSGVRAAPLVNSLADKAGDYFRRHWKTGLGLPKADQVRRPLSHLKPNWPFMVMGPKATVSVGIAIGHVRAPMQDTIQAAREAEREAKATPGKSAFALRILKRSGEAVSFAAKWDSGVPAVWSELNAGVHNLSSRFAYRYTPNSSRRSL